MILSRIDRVIKAKKDFKLYIMQRDKNLLRNRKAYIDYFINVWLPANDPDVNMTEAVRELSEFHLFVSESTVYKALSDY